ncbi:MAG: sulfatase [Pirellulaceae bacterium]|nr:sulfatase [Pirellulaceae bacterium]
MLKSKSLAIAALVVMCWALDAGRLCAADRPNVLFIAVDDLNDWVRCLGGHPDCRTPHIDRLAERGVLFTRSYCAAPACNPSRAALLTGIRPWKSGVYVNPQPWRQALPDAVTLPQHFMANGYRVLGGGKIFHGRYRDAASWDVYQKSFGDPKPTAKVAKDPHSRAGGVVWGKLDVNDSQMSDYKVVSWAAEQLAQERDKPLFLACGVFRPHMPWQVPRKYYDMYPVDKIQMPPAMKDDLQDIPAAGVRMARPQGDHATILKTKNWRHAVQAYLASITFADAQVGRLLDALDKSAYRDNTIVVLWGDHGWHLGEKEHWRKFALWEEATRAPLIIAAPGVTKPQSVCSRTVDFMDIYPTLADLCGLPIGDHLDGVSLRPWLEDPRRARLRPAVTTHGRNNHAVRTERFRYIRYADGSEELYDHDEDPNEWKNLAKNSEFAKYKADLAKWLPKQNAPDAPYDKTLRQSRNRGKQKTP